MTHAITVSDEDYLRLERAAQSARRTPEALISELISGLLVPAKGSPPEEYDRRWEEFMRLAGSVHGGRPLRNDDIDELIGEEAAATHATNPGDADTPD